MACGLHISYYLQLKLYKSISSRGGAMEPYRPRCRTSNYREHSVLDAVKGYSGRSDALRRYKVHCEQVGASYSRQNIYHVIHDC